MRVTAPPVEGAANEAVITLLADMLGIAKSNIDIVAGLTNTNKLVSIIGIDPTVLDEKLKAVSKSEVKDSPAKESKLSKLKSKLKSKSGKKK